MLLLSLGILPDKLFAEPFSRLLFLALVPLLAFSPVYFLWKQRERGKDDRLEPGLVAVLESRVRSLKTLNDADYETLVKKGKRERVLERHRQRL